MSAVVQRVVTQPQVGTEYLTDSGSWGARDTAHVYPSHAIADGIAKQLRGELEAARRAGSVELTVAFVHARTVSVNELVKVKNVWRLKIEGIGINAPLPEPRSYLAGGPMQTKDVEPGSGDGPGPGVRASFKVKMDPRRLAEVRRDPVECYE